MNLNSHNESLKAIIQVVVCWLVNYILILEYVGMYGSMSTMECWHFLMLLLIYVISTFSPSFPFDKLKKIY